MMFKNALIFTFTLPLLLAGVASSALAEPIGHQVARPGRLDTRSPAPPILGGKVSICHVPAGDPAHVRAIRVDAHALAAHLDHGDYLPNTYYRDFDGDMNGDPDLSISGCVVPEGYVANDWDCDDTEPLANPGMDEICGDGIDNDCQAGDCPEGCHFVNGTLWCGPGPPGAGCNAVCGIYGLSPLTDNAEWLESQNSADKCWDIATSFGIPNISINYFTYACTEVAGGGTRMFCSTFPHCPSYLRGAAGDGLPAICPCEE